MASPANGQTGLDAAILAARRGWFGVLYLLSRESKASTAAFVVTILSDLIQFSVFPILTCVALVPGPSFRAAFTALSVTILDVDTLFALADAGASSGRAILFWAALTVVMVFLSLLFYVIGILLSEGRQQAIVLRLLGSTASILTTVAFMPTASLLLAVFHGCNSVDALGVQCRQDGHWVVMTLVVLVLTVFTAVSTFFASVYIDTDLTSTAWGAKVTGRVDAAMLVIKLVLVTCFTALSLPPAAQAVLAGGGALVWLGGTIFVQPYVQPMANSLAAAAAGVNAWLVLVVAILLFSPTSDAGSLIAVGLVGAPVLGFLANGAYRSAVVSSDFSSLRSALQADIWARGRVVLAQKLEAKAPSVSARGTGRKQSSGRGERRPAAPAQGPSRPHRGSATAGGPGGAGGDAHSGVGVAGRARRPSRARPGLIRAPSATSLVYRQVPPPEKRFKVHVLADDGDADHDVRQAEPVTTSTLLPGVTMESLLSQAGMAYDEMLKTWPKSAVTYASGSIFHRAYGSTVSSELTILAMARKQVGGAWDVSFLSYQRTRQLQERTGSALSAVDRILFEEAWSAAVEDAIKCFALQNRLYSHAVETRPDIATLGDLTLKLYTARTTAEQRFRTMLSINPESIMALRAYSRFCDEVLGDPDRAAELRNKASRIEEKHAKTNVRSLDSVTVGTPDDALSVMDEMNAVVTMTGDLRRYGEITDVNLAGARLFGRARSDLIGQSVSALFPEPLGLYYDAAILSYLSPHDQNESFARGTHVSIIQTAGGWLAAARVSLQEGAGSELDATPCLSMVVQRAPTKRRMLVVGDAEAGFPVLAMDAESMVLLGDAASPEDGESSGAGVASPSDAADGGRSEDGRAVSPPGLAGRGRGDGAWPSGRGELQLLQWMPDLGKLAAAALSSAAGAQAELIVRHTAYNDEEEDEDDDAGSAGDDARSTGTDEYDAALLPGRRRGGGRSVRLEGGGGPVRLRMAIQALHPGVLSGRRVRSGEEPTHWVVTWEPPRATPGKAFVTAPSAPSRPKRPRRATEAHTSASDPAYHGSVRRSAAGSAPRRSAAAKQGEQGASSASSVRRARSSGLRASEPDSKVHPSGVLVPVLASDSIASVDFGAGADSAHNVVSGASGIQAVPGAGGRRQLSIGAISESDAADSVHDALLDAAGGGRGRGAAGAGAASMASTSTSARSITNRVVDTALAKPDPLIRGIFFIVIASLAAVVAFSTALAIAVPIINSSAELLLRSSDLAERRAYHADVSMGKWYQLISVSIGFTAIDDWDTLLSNLTTSTDKYEAAHRELASVVQEVNGELNAFEQQRGWRVCTATTAFARCDGYELMSASDFVEFTIFHLRQLADLPFGGIVLRDPTDPRIITGYHNSLFILVPNIDLMGLALDRAAETSSRELAEGLEGKLGTMTVVLVAVAVVTFAVATLGTTLLMSKVGRLRFHILASIAQVPRKQLKAMAAQMEHAQTAFATAIGANAGDDDAMMQDVEPSPREKSRRDLFRLSSHGPRDSDAGVARGGPLQAGGTVGSARIVALTSPSNHGPACTRCCRRATAQRRRRFGRRIVTDSSCFVLGKSCTVTAPLALTAVWVAAILVMISSMFSSVVIDAARSEQLQTYAAGTSALRGRIEVVLIVTRADRSEALAEARTNSTVILQSLGAVLNGAPTSGFGRRLPGLAETKVGSAARLFDIMLHDSCLALQKGSWEHGWCRELHEQYGLKGLHSFTTAMLDDGVQARSVFNETDTADARGIGELFASGDINTIIPPMRRYSTKSSMSEILLQHVVNITAESARSHFDSTWAQLQQVLGLFAAGFVLVVWLWALPAVRKVESVRRALLTMLRSLPEEAIVTTPEVQDTVTRVASLYGMAQAARALRSLAKAAEQRERVAFASQSRARALLASPITSHGTYGTATEAAPGAFGSRPYAVPGHGTQPSVMSASEITPHSPGPVALTGLASPAAVPDEVNAAATSLAMCDDLGDDLEEETLE